MVWGRLAASTEYLLRVGDHFECHLWTTAAVRHHPNLVLNAPLFRALSRRVSSRYCARCRGRDFSRFQDNPAYPQFTLYRDLVPVVCSALQRPPGLLHCILPLLSLDSLMRCYSGEHKVDPGCTLLFWSLTQSLRSGCTRTSKNVNPHMMTE